MGKYDELEGMDNATRCIDCGNEFEECICKEMMEHFNPDELMDPEECDDFPLSLEYPEEDMMDHGGGWDE